jgi:sucrose-phosphate synthase
VFFFNIKSQHELAATYRYFAKRGSVFSLTAFYEPFGLAPVEAAACGLAVVATKNGGQSEVFGDGSGILVDPSDERDIREGLLKGLTEHEHYARLGGLRAREKYTWDKSAAAYLSVIREGAERSLKKDIPLPALDSSDRMMKYLSEK